MKIFLDSKEFLHEGVRTKWIEGTNNKYAVREDGEIVSYKNKKPKILNKSYHEKGYQKINIKYGIEVKNKKGTQISCTGIYCKSRTRDI